MTIQMAEQQTLIHLKKMYEEREATTISDWVMENITRNTKIDRLLNKEQFLSEEEMNKLNNVLSELATYKPIQYVLGEAWFAGMKFFVNQHTLIPRPETEELVNWIVGESEKLKVKSENVLDIGTGCGCIPIALKKKLPRLSIVSIDVSKDALEVAQLNAHALQTDIRLLTIDFLDERNWGPLPIFDIIVSNPPYIRQSEKESMAKNVLDFEPSVALFVPDDDALIFYRKIAAFGKTHLSDTGLIYLEINEMLGKEVVDLFCMMGYTVELRKDMQGKDRMVKAKSI